jgi:TDG/mug DNA glycosylase family protein
VSDEKPRRPTKQQLREAQGKFVRDIIAPGLRVLFCGINPGLYSAAVGHHFARPGNRFWPALKRGGFTPKVLSPFDEQELLKWRLGITNIVNRATAGAAELKRDDLRTGARALERKMRRYRPRFLAVLGVGAYREAFGEPKAAVGMQEKTIGPTRVWVLPNPSGLNAHYQIAELGRLFAALRHAAGE